LTDFLSPVWNEKNHPKNMDLVNLKKHERYLFGKQKPDGSLGHFRANYLGLYDIQDRSILICNKCDDQTDITHYHMDADNIVQVNTLLTLLENHPCKLPDDVLLVINSFW